MKKILLWIILCCSGSSLAACVTESTYGNFIGDTQFSSAQKKIAQDFAEQIMVLYPQKQTGFALQQPISDVFGERLTGTLRRNGYAIFSNENDDNENKALAKAALRGKTIALSYVIDETKGTDFYHVTVFIGNQSLTRGYSFQSGLALPVTDWIYQG